MQQPIDIRRFALNILTRNSNFSNNPQAKEYLEVIRSGDNEKGRQLAENICKTYGVNYEDACQKAMEAFFGNR